jgi:hypothetical protein
VAGQITLCRELMKESPGIQHDEALKDLVGFLVRSTSAALNSAISSLPRTHTLPHT